MLRVSVRRHGLRGAVLLGVAALGDVRAVGLNVILHADDIVFGEPVVHGLVQSLQ
ncbi:hypothetical protein PF003_g22328 [Phytophthora fragariae]|nr:hypothetical protein PF003_g22328 [Phytophthora fragariae]